MGGSKTPLPKFFGFRCNNELYKWCKKHQPKFVREILTQYMNGELVKGGEMKTNESGNQPPSFSSDSEIFPPNPQLITGDKTQVCNYGDVKGIIVKKNVEMIYCDSPYKKSLPRNRMIPLTSCNLCNKRIEYNKEQKRKEESAKRPISSFQVGRLNLYPVPCPKTKNLVPYSRCDKCDDFFKCTSIDEIIKQQQEI